MKIAHWAAKKKAPESAQNRITQIPVQRWHRPRRDPTPKSITHHEVVSFTQFFDKRSECGKIVTVVRIPHDDVPASGRLDPAHQSVAIAFGLDRHDSCALGLGDRLRTIGATVVSDNDLAGDSVF